MIGGRRFASASTFPYDVSRNSLPPGNIMAKLNLSVAVGPYDRTRALIDGSVQIDGVKPACMTLSPEEIFFRALRHAEFDICELSLSSFTVKTAQGGGDYVACRPSCRAPSATPRSMCAPTASRNRRTSRAS